MRDNKTRKNKRKGGKLLAHGVYGCIFQPPLICATSSLDITNATKVGKVLKKQKEARIEYDIGLKLRKTSYWKKFFILPTSTCKLASRKRQSETGLDKCPIIKNRPTGKYTMLSMNYGGIPLQLDGMMTATEFNKYAIRLIRAGSVLQHNRVVHLDLHGNNILIDNGIPKIIDFGLAVDMDKPLSQEYIEHQPTLSAYQETPEMATINAVVNGWNIRQTIKAFLEKRRFLEKITKAPITNELTNFVIAESELYKNKNMLQLFHKYWDKQDSWAIGFELSKILYSIKKKDITNSELNEHVLFCMERMIEIDPRKRYSCIECLQNLFQTGVLHKS